MVVELVNSAVLSSVVLEYRDTTGAYNRYTYVGVGPSRCATFILVIS